VKNTKSDETFNAENTPGAYSLDPNQLTILQRLKETAKTAGHELISKENILPKAMLLGSIACMAAYEWGPLNEMVAGYVGVSAQQAWANPNNLSDLLLSSLAVGSATGYLTGAQQAASGLLMAGGVRHFPNTFKFWDQSRKHEIDENKKKHGDIATALILGTSAAVIEQNARDPERTFKKDAKMALGMAALIGTFNTALITAVSVGVQYMEKAGWETAADITLEVVKNPLTYIGLFGAIKGIQYIKDRQKLKKASSTSTFTN
jgi:hypothetical protein